jgi:AcrR family transcriptional regulator
MPKVSERHAEARRRQILDAARVCFARGGLHRTSMQDVFRESGLSPGSVYTYFFGKEEIVRAVAEEVLRAPDGNETLVVQLWAEALHDPRIMELVRASDASVRPALLERALTPP